MTNEVIEHLKRYCDGKENTEKVEISVLQLRRIIKALEQQTCEDAISRKTTVERLCKVAEFMNEKRDGLGSPYVMAALFIQDNKEEFPSVQPKTTVCEDAVSREAAIDAVNDVIADYVPNIFGRYEALPLEVASAINRLPPVNPQPKTGHWIKYGKLYQCSECKELSCCQGKFCNECGAKMVEPQESEDGKCHIV